MASGIEGSTIDEELDNWDDVDTAPPPKQAPGYYYGKIVEAKVTPTKEGKPGITVGVKLDRSFDEGGPAVTTKYPITTKLGIHKDAAWKAKQLFTSASVEGPKRNGHEHLVALCNGLLGQDVIVRTSIRKYAALDGSGWKEAVDLAEFCTVDTIAAARAPKDGSGATTTASPAAAAGEAAATGRRGRRSAA